MPLIDLIKLPTSIQDSVNVAQRGLNSNVGNTVREGLLGNTVYHKTKRGFSIREFHARLNEKKGLMLPSLFLVEIQLKDKALTSWAGKAVHKNARESIPFFCQQAVIPGISFANADIKNEGWGSLDRRPYQAIFPDPTLTFMLDQEGMILDFFHNWARNVVNFNRRTPDSQVGGALPWETYYRDNYICEIIVTTFDSVGNEVHQYKLHECYPNILGDVELNWATNDQIASLPVTFQMRWWEKETFPIPSIGEDRGAGIFEFMARTLASGFANLPGSILGGNLSVQDALNTAANAVLKKVNVFGDFFDN